MVSHCWYPVRMKIHLPSSLIHALALAGLLAGSAVPQAQASDSPQHAARLAVQQGRYVPLQQVVRDALRLHPGQLLEVELDQDDHRYEVEILLADGVVAELDYDARTGKLLKTELERD